MTNYEIAVFLHIVGVAGMFAGIGASLGVLHFAKRASDVASVRALLPLGALAGKSIPIFSVLVFASGAYLVEDVWNWDFAWIQVSLAAFVVLFAMGPLINARRMKAIGMEAGRAADGPIPDSVRARLNDPILHLSETTMTAATVGIVYLMVIKPGMSGALVSMFVAIGLGVLVFSLEFFLGRATDRLETGRRENLPPVT